MYKRFILLLGLFLGMHMQTAAQIPAAQVIPAQERLAPITTLHSVPAPSFGAPFTLFEAGVKSPTHLSYRFAEAYKRDQSLESLWPMHEVKTLFLTLSSLPLLQLCGGRLRLEGFKSTLHMQNVQLDQSSLGGPRSGSFQGLSLSFHFGRDAQIGRPTQIWRSLARIVGTPR
ncbi:MAG: hypothetical protein WBQ61_07290 [Candidatus Acidiferrum sp.]